MSAKAGAAASIAIGIIAIIAAIPSGGASLSALAAIQAGLTIVGGAAMVGVGIYTLAFAPKASSAGGARSADLQYASAADGVPLPVIFGEQRVVGNFMNYTSDNFRSVKVLGRSGGKGGDATPASTIGFDYFLTYEYGLCMGPIDEIVQVYGAPGEKVMLGDDPTPVVYSASDEYKELVLDSVDPIAANGSEGGICRLYRGSIDQSRLVTGDPYNFETTLATGRIKRGYTYKIVIRTSVDFTDFGAASNDVGETFVADNTSGDVLTVNDSVIEYSGLNYHNVCWALMMDFKIGRLPQPKSYHFILRRYPVHNTSFEMLRPDGTAITGFRVRGSTDTGKPAYTQANPAAILYECLTNRIWGRALDQEMFDEASWVSVSQFFASRHIGMSFSIDTQDKIGSIVDGIRSQLKTITTWDGEFLKLRCLLDLTTTHGAVQTLNSTTCISIKAIRPLWHVTTNEIRAEFLNKSKNYRPDAVHVTDLGNRQMTGRVNSERIQLNGFIDYNTVRRQAFRILREKSYPAMSFEIVLNRFKSQLEVGDVFQLQWDDYDQDSTMYCIVTKIEDSDSSSDDIMLSATQDQTFIPAEGHEAVPSAPSVSPWELIPDLDETEIGLWTGLPLISPTGNFPVVVIELPPILSNQLFGVTYRGTIAIIAHQPAAYHTAVKVYVSRTSGGTYVQAPHEPPSFGHAGELTSDFTLLDQWDRTSTGFTFSLFDPSKDEATILSMFSLVDSIHDDLEEVIDLNGPFVIIQNEILQVGVVEKIGTNSYRARNIVRGRFGTKIAERLDGTRVMFTQTLSDKVIGLTDIGTIPGIPNFSPGTRVHFRAVAVARTTSLAAPLNDNLPFYIYSDNIDYDFTLDDELFIRASDRPLSGLFYEVIDAGATWTIRFRIRRRAVGAETTSSFYGPSEIGYVDDGPGTLGFIVYLQDTTLTQFGRVAIEDHVETFDSATGLMTISGISKTFIYNSAGALYTTTADRILISTAETSGVFSGLDSRPDLVIQL